MISGKNKVVASFAVILLLSVSTIAFIGSADNDTEYGTATLGNIPANAIPVSSAADLARVGTGQSSGGYTWSLSAYYYQTVNITLSGLFTPIGSSSSPFTGTYNGQGYTIRGLAVNSTGTNTSSIYGGGMFMYISGATLANIELVNVNVIGGTYHTGGLAATAVNSTISNCVVSGLVNINYSGSGQSPQYQVVGGIVGFAMNSLIEKCVNYANVNMYGRSGNNQGTGAAGGIAGGNSTVNTTGTLTISQCANYGSIYANTQLTSIGIHAAAGGIIGMSYGATGSSLIVKDCYNSGSVSTHTSSSGSTVSLVASGGILGGLRNGQLGGSWTISNCYNEGTISAVRQNTSNAQNMPGAGGIVGSSNQIGSGSSTPGGNVSIVNCYFLENKIYRNGALHSNVLIGRGDSTIDGSSVPARSSIQASASKTDAQMKPTQATALSGSSIYYTGVTRGNIAGWDFNNVWVMKGGYPMLRALGIEITSSPSNTSMIAGNTFSYTPLTNTGPASFSVSGASWLTVVGGNVVGTPTTAGTYTVTITATFGSQTATQTFMITVHAKLAFNSMPTGSILISPAMGVLA